MIFTVGMSWTLMNQKGNQPFRIQICQTSQWYPTLQSHGLYSTWNSPGQNTGVGSHSPGDLFNPGIKPDLPHCRLILYQLSHQGSPRILEWVVYPFSCGSSRPRNGTSVPCIAGGFLSNWAMRESLYFYYNIILCYSDNFKVVLKAYTYLTASLWLPYDV